MLNGYIDTLPCHEVQYQRVIQKGITYKMKEKLKVLMSEFNYINYTYEKKCGKITVKRVT